MGRRTYESLPKGALPNRTNVVITSDAAENYPGCIVVRSVEEALSRCSNQEKIFVIGGGRLYRATIGLADRLSLTRIHHSFSDADTFFPEINFDEWTLTKKEAHAADNKHRYPYTFLTYSKK